MSTAGRATYHAAVGRASNTIIQSRALRARDSSSYTRLKVRTVGQGSREELAQRDLKADIARREAIAAGLPPPEKKEEEETEKPLMIKNAPVTEEISAISAKYDDEDVEDESDDGFDTSSDEEEEDDDDSDDEDDDEAALQAELNRIRAERAAAAARQAAEQAEIEMKQRQDEAIRSNPLVNIQGNLSAKVKRSWNDDVVFRNQARDEPVAKKRFVNDTLRSDFHRSFLKKFVK